MHMRTNVKPDATVRQDILLIVPRIYSSRPLGTTNVCLHQASQGSFI